MYSMSYLGDLFFGLFFRGYISWKPMIAYVYSPNICACHEKWRKYSHETSIPECPWLPNTWIVYVWCSKTHETCLSLPCRSEQTGHIGAWACHLTPGDRRVNFGFPFKGNNLKVFSSVCLEQMSCSAHGSGTVLFKAYIFWNKADVGSPSLKLINVGILLRQEACFQQGLLNYPDCMGESSNNKCNGHAEQLPTMQFLGWKKMCLFTGKNLPKGWNFTYLEDPSMMTPV